MATAGVEQGGVPDVVIHSAPRSQKDHRPRQFPRRGETEEAEVSPRPSLPSTDQRRKGRGEGSRGVGHPHHHRQQVAAPNPRRTSEPALLPPIRGSSLPQADTSPARDVNEASSPVSNVSLHGGVAEDGSGVQTIAAFMGGVAEREVRSPANRRDTQSIMSMVEASDSPRLSPIVSSDHVRLKSERRRLKSVNDLTNDVTVGVKTPTIPVDNGTKAAVKSKTSRRVSLQSLPKLTLGEEPFSIRRKIEQFRKWHEEQYTDKLKKLKGEAEKEQRANTPQRTPRLKSVEIDFTKILEENMKNTSKTTKRDDQKDRKGNKLIELEDTQPSHDKRGRTARCKSSGTWRTWRDVNDSYAYDNVTKYIEENELLPQERVDWINSWLGDVEKAFGAYGNDDDTDSLEEVSAGLGHL